MNLLLFSRHLLIHTHSNALAPRLAASAIACFPAHLHGSDRNSYTEDYLRGFHAASYPCDLRISCFLLQSVSRHCNSKNKSSGIWVMRRYAISCSYECDVWRTRIGRADVSTWAMVTTFSLRVAWVVQVVTFITNPQITFFFVFHHLLHCFTNHHHH